MARRLHPYRCRVVEVAVLTLKELIEVIDGHVMTGDPTRVRVRVVAASDRISDLLDQATSDTLFLTNLSSRQLVELASLMDVPAICFVSGRVPDSGVVAAALERGRILVSARGDLAETHDLLLRRLHASEGVS